MSHTRTKHQIIMMDELLNNSEEPIEGANSAENIEQLPVADEIMTEDEQAEDESFSKMSRQELLAKFNELIKTEKIESVIYSVEKIKTAFYKTYRADYEVARDKYKEQNEGSIEGFKFSDENQEDTFKELYNLFKDKKAAYHKQQEEEMTNNLNKKNQIIEEIRSLVNKEESLNVTFQIFHGLQDQWREIGNVPQASQKSLSDAYNYAVEQFYNYIKINKELRDLDFRNNMEQKIELCEKAEALMMQESIVKAFKTLQEYHNQWREIGPVPSEQKEDLWDRFKNATSVINKKYQDYFESQKEQQIKNLEQKTALCERIEEMVASTIEHAKDWEEKTAEVLKIQELWRTIGYAPKKDNNKIYQRFKTASDQFFAKKRDFYKTIKEGQKTNLQLKIELCEKAEALKDSTDWKKTSDAFLQLQKKWKEVGQVPHKQVEPLWKRFREACDCFFNAKAEHFKSVGSDQEENLKRKQELIDRVVNFEKSADDKENMRRLMDIQKEWSSIGHVPLNKKEQVQKAFRDSINAQFASIKVNAGERDKANFKNKIDTWVETKSNGKIYAERNKIVTQIRETENEILLYENNMGFFSKSANSEAMIEDIKRKIANSKNRLVSLKEKLQMLNNIE